MEHVGTFVKALRRPF